MAAIQKISIALTADMLAMVRRAVETGDYASTSEVVREALRQWKAGRTPSSAIHPAGTAPRTKTPAARTGVNPGEALMQRHHEGIIELCRWYQVRRLGQFGSVLRADFDAARSDVDLAVEFAEPTGRSAARQYFDFKTALEKLLARDVDLIELTAMPDSRLRRLIERTQVPLYAEAA